MQAILVSPLRRALFMAQATIDGMYVDGASLPPVYVVDALREQYSGQIGRAHV